MVDSFHMTVNGQSVAHHRTLPVVNPATGQIFAEAPDCTAAELDAAVVAAREAFPAWAATPIAERQAAIRAFGQIIRDNLEELKAIFTKEQGKPVAMAEMELFYSAMWCDGCSMLAPPVTVIEDTDERIIEVRHPPLGVVCGIVPWNFPIMLAIMKLAPALVAGCTMVLKPAPTTPLTLLRIAELAAGVLPPGVLNVVSGGEALGPMMTAHPGFDKISFTGSSATGSLVMATAATSLKRVTLELGGNDPAIVLPDVDVATLAPVLFWAAFQNSAQFCLASKRLYIHEDIYEPLTQAIIDYAHTVAMGDGFEPGVRLGPIQNERQFNRVRKLVEQAKADGLSPRYEGAVPAGPGFFFPVTIFDNPPHDAAIVTEEAFGPVLPILRFGTIDEVVDAANASDYGLGASVWSADWEKARAVAERLESGVVWVNEIHYQTPFTPMGGWKQSGLGVENGVEGLLEYTATQTLSMRKAPAAVTPFA